MKLIMTTGVIYTGGGIYTVCGFAQNKDGNTLFFETGADYNDFDALTFYSKYPYETENTDCFPSYVPLPDMESHVEDCFGPDTTEYREFWMQICQFCKDTDVRDVGDAIRNDLMERLISEYGTACGDNKEETAMSFETMRGDTITISKTEHGLLAIKVQNADEDFTKRYTFDSEELWKVLRLIRYMKDQDIDVAFLPGWADMDAFYCTFGNLIDHADLLEFDVFRTDTL